MTTGLELGAKLWVQGRGQPLGTRQPRRCGEETAAPAPEPETEAPSTCWTRARCAKPATAFAAETLHLLYRRAGEKAWT